ncbi:hypothetical protein BO83DRAFT_222692 [Aspergillus eucalypticola CBS 122712]|uniref:Secreted protein n=1 Tax=Aspergillus eucalypticola (strain CBS 122712 / IBT 29274) TaxID=1448314 RepID=A0A317VXI5_ASPEC|nr:uncharacterized protein BO83DRAFT_222692 [Aspergillus eucalypticola CBS 122712]PWY77667.1 hypothetical protein BO83DRAFT_222692 [Aspergillus eucalypticola CBS 122712]
MIISICIASILSKLFLPCFSLLSPAPLQHFTAYYLRRNNSSTMNLTEEPSTITLTTPKASITGTTIAIILEEHSLR